MKIGLISDIHGNDIALQAALNSIGKVDRLICLGDAVLFGPQPRQVLQHLQELGCPVVMGNTDAWILTPGRVPFIPNPTPQIVAIENWCTDQLTEPELAYVASFQPSLTIDLGKGLELFCFHGSPRGISEVILAATPDEELNTMLAGAPKGILAGGHTHRQLLRGLDEWRIINPGSVGHPVERTSAGQVVYPARADFALISTESGDVGIEFRQVRYDLAPLVQAANESGMPHADWWIKNWLAAG